MCGDTSRYGRNAALFVARAFSRAALASAASFLRWSNSRRGASATSNRTASRVAFRARRLKGFEIRISWNSGVYVPRTSVSDACAVSHCASATVSGCAATGRVGCCLADLSTGAPYAAVSVSMMSLFVQSVCSLAVVADDDLIQRVVKEREHDSPDWIGGPGRSSAVGT